MPREVDGFLARIRAAPEDDGPRLIYADWLDEAGDPRGELVRVQVALARVAASDPRRPELARAEADLLDRYADLWATPFRGLATGPVFRRGFVEEVKVTARQFLSHPEELFRAGPIRHLHLLDVASHLNAALASPHLAPLTGLTIYAQHLREGLAHALAESPHLDGLKLLHVGRNPVGPAGAGWLAGAAGLGALEDLDLSEAELNDFAAVILARTERLPSLKRLELRGNAIGPAGAAALAAGLPKLERLGLAGNRFGGRRAGRPDALFRVPQLDLAGNGLAPEDLRWLLAAAPDPRGGPVGLRQVDLGANPLGDDGAALLATAPVAACLTHLRLSGAGVTDAGLLVLARSPYLTRLVALDLSNNPVSDAGCQALLESRSLTRLTRLAFPGIGISFRMRLALERKYNQGAG